MRISKLKLAAAMFKQGFSFTDLSKACGVSRTTLSYINNGKTCSPNVLCRIANVLSVEPTELIETE